MTGNIVILHKCTKIHDHMLSWCPPPLSSARQRGTAKLQEPGWGHIQGGEDDFRQSSRGGGETALS